MKEDKEHSGGALVPSASSAPTRKSSGLARRGLDDLLNKQSRIDSFLSIGAEFDEATYARAKPYFEAGIELQKDMAPVEALRALMHELRDVHGFQLDQIGAMKPYVVRYIQELERDKAWARLAELADKLMTDVQAVAKFFPDPWDRLDSDELTEDVEVEAFRLSQVQNPELNCWQKLKALRWLYLWGNAVSEPELDKLNHELKSAYDAKQMMEALNEDGFRDENGQPFSNVDDLLRAVDDFLLEQAHRR